SDLIYAAEWAKDGDELVLSITARAFCHQMVRSIVALSMDIGRGRLDPEAVPAVIEAKDRNAASGTAPPHGLVLWEVGY
ncbi:MAG: tRNA pseudouridine(38-40) synthase TruA, partial [Acidimicrobiia bacterium]|nr:tRNA pseudouridine(38-40) synthase TruA [Acidimicrobiia bacterium]